FSFWNQLEAIVGYRPAPYVTVFGDHLIAGAVGVVDEHLVVATPTYSAVADLVADRLRIPKAFDQVLFQAGIIEVVGRIDVAPVFVVFLVRQLEQEPDISAFDSAPVLFAK